MAKTVNDGCIFCDPSPCSCSTKPKKAPLAVKAARPSVNPAPPSPMVEAQRVGLSAVRRKPVVERPVPVPPPVPVVVKSAPPRDEELARAVTIIANAGLLDMREMQKHRELIDLPDARLKAIDWRRRNVESTT